MFKLLRKITSTDVAEKTVNEVIEEIHESFYTEVDKLLASANIAHSLDTDKQALIDKCATLKSLGFTSTKEVIEATKEIARLENLKRDNESKKEIIEAINYFRFKYPNYKFITEESVKKICDKYNLIYGPVGNYIGTVPDKNLKHIQEFQVQDEDVCFFEEDFYLGPFGEQTFRSKFRSLASWKQEKEMERQKAVDEFKYATIELRSRRFGMRSGPIQTDEHECPLEIAAPQKDFDLRGMELKDRQLTKKIEIPDPIVLKPVFYAGKKHYLIVTAWGIEASDESVVNHINN